MKKIFALVVALVAAVSVNAQNAGEKFFKPMVGATLSTFTSADDAKMKFGIAAGAELGYFVADPFVLTAGVLVSMQGSGYKNTDHFKDYTTTTTYINVPILANYYIAPGFALKAGIQPGFLISAKDKGETNVAGSWQEFDHSGTDGMKTFDLAIPLGLSYEFSDFVIDARYNLGISKVFEVGDAKNAVIMLTLGYKVPF